MGEQRISYLVRHAQLTAIGVGVAAQHISAVGIRLASEAAPEMADRSLFRAAEPSAFVALHTRARIGRAYRAVFRAFLIRAARRAIIQRVARKTNVTVFRGPWITALDTPGRGWPRRSVDGNLLACEAERRRRPAVAVLATRRAAGRAQIAVRARLKETVGLPSGRASEPVRDRAHGRIGKSTFSHAVIQTAAHSTQPQPQQQPQQQRTSSAHIGSHVPCVEQATVPTVISLRHVSSTPVHATHWLASDGRLLSHAQAEAEADDADLDFSAQTMMDAGWVAVGERGKKTTGRELDGSWDQMPDRGDS